MLKPSSIMIMAAVGAVDLACDNGTDSSRAPATASSACTTLHAARAERASRCLGGLRDDWLAYNDGVEDCAAYDQQVSDGWVAYHPELWLTCRQQYEGACEQTVDNCFYEVLAGQVTNGGLCTTSAVCDVESVCINFTDNACGAVCTAPARDGQPCTPFCASGLSCLGGLCVPAGGIGAACGGPQNLSCAPALFCEIQAPAVDGTCSERRTGSTCRMSGDCVVSEFCLAGRCATRRAAGEPCDDAPDGCAAWTVCESSTVPSVCVSAGRPGQACIVFPGTDYPVCLGPSMCGTGSICFALSRPGESCSSQVCVEGNICDPTSVICRQCPG